MATNSVVCNRLKRFVKNPAATAGQKIALIGTDANAPESPTSIKRECESCPATPTSIMANKHQPFEFVPVSGTNIRGDAATRRRVRSRAQADYRRKNPPAPKTALNDHFDVGQWLRVLSHDTSVIGPTELRAPRAAAQRSASSNSTIARLSPFEQKGSDVFQLLSTAERNRAQILWQHCKLFASTCCNTH